MGHSKYGLASLAAPMTGGRVSPFPWQRYRSGRRTDAIAPHAELTNSPPQIARYLSETRKRRFASDCVVQTDGYERTSPVLRGK
jgi:hypothetical protein